jgi:hypothetical protein
MEESQSKADDEATSSFPPHEVRILAERAAVNRVLAHTQGGQPQMFTAKRQK